MQILVEEEKIQFEYISVELKKEIDTVKTLVDTPGFDKKDKTLQQSLERFTNHLKERKHFQFQRELQEFRKKCLEMGLEESDLEGLEALEGLLEESSRAPGLGPFTNLKTRKLPPLGDFRNVDLFVELVGDEIKALGQDLIFSQFGCKAMTFEVIVVDFSQIRGLWETRVRKHKERCKMEKERLETSALQKIKQEWSFMLECKNKGIPQSEYLKNGFVDNELKILDTHQRNSSVSKQSPYKKEKPETNKFVFNLYGSDWQELPDYLREQTYLKEWHIHKTRIHTIPEYIQMFEDMNVLDMSQNKITCLPPEIGCLRNLRELNVSFNNLKNIPPELGDCENLEKLDVSGNFELTELPFEV
ncbi:uncharacterized protein LOC142757698 [Rhinoderma darwinii]|uniref:uncharacterized protein LOC142757698 n=1 Tax=Rhinoderma darwinii TaxID=43563 RepID=UPI003F673C4E